jgi:hypothetical protein
MVTTLLKTNQDTHAFLSSHPDPDEVICWGCPACHARNYGTHFSHATRCGVCGKGSFPAIPLPIVGDGGTSMVRAYQNERMRCIDEEIKESKEKIREYECEIEECECYLSELKKERVGIESLLVVK